MYGAVGYSTFCDQVKPYPNFILDDLDKIIDRKINAFSKFISKRCIKETDCTINNYKNIVEINQKQLKSKEHAFYLRGYLHGKQLREKIQGIYNPIIELLIDGCDDIEETARTYEARIPHSFIEEMKGLADGAKVRYQDVLIIHTFLDIVPGQFGCSSRVDLKSIELEEAIKGAEDDFKSGKLQKSFFHRSITCSNHSKENDELEGESQSRRNDLHSAFSSVDDRPELLLEASAVSSTIQSIFFDLSHGTIRLASDSHNAVLSPFVEFHPFNNREVLNRDYHCFLYRNLDWNWTTLGEHSTVRIYQVGEKEVCSIGFSGYLGSLSGMNYDLSTGQSLAISFNQNGVENNEEGMPLPLLLTLILETCGSIEEIEEFLTHNRPASGGNLMVADLHGGACFEIDGEDGSFIITRKLDPSSFENDNEQTISDTPFIERNTTNGESATLSLLQIDLQKLKGFSLPKEVTERLKEQLTQFSPELLANPKKKISGSNYKLDLQKLKGFSLPKEVTERLKEQLTQISPELLAKLEKRMSDLNDKFDLQNLKGLSITDNSTLVEKPF